MGDNITDEAAVFYLEMNQFNVAAAVGSYFDLEAGAEAKASPPQMMFVRDVTIGEGESVPPNTMFIKTWQVRFLTINDNSFNGKIGKDSNSCGQFIGRPQTFVELQLRFKLHFYTKKKCSLKCNWSSTNVCGRPMN